MFLKTWPINACPSIGSRNLRRRQPSVSYRGVDRITYAQWRSKLQLIDNFLTHADEVSTLILHTSLQEENDDENASLILS